MKRTFSLVHPKIKPARLVDSARHDVKKFVKKERSMPTGKDVQFWDFEVKFGRSEETAELIDFKSLNQHMDQLLSDDAEQMFIEIITVAGVLPEPVEPEDAFDIEPEEIDDELDD